MYGVEHDNWAGYATMHFVGNAALWLQNVEAEEDVETWEELCVAVHAKFGRDKHHRALEALERCRQVASVEQYYFKFEELRHKVLVHNRHYDEAFFVTKFVNGLKREIWRAIKLHKPRTVDAALSLAETQEEMLEEARSYSSSRYKHDYQQSFSRGGFSGRGILSREESKKPEDKTTSKPAWENKFQTLKAQRRARGECFKCGGKYQPGHKCNTSVPLNIVEELVDLLQISQSEGEQSDTDGDTSGNENLMHISQCAMAGTVQKKSFRLQGTIAGKQVLLLVDSGSCGSFISSDAVKRLGLETISVPPVNVAMANGAKTEVNTAVPGVKWECQKATFNTDMRVFDLPHYDIIVGMDWLQTLGPMWIDWDKRTFRIRQAGKRITVRGVKDKADECKPITMEELQCLQDLHAVSHLVELRTVTHGDPDMPQCIAELLQENADCFKPPKGLPPQRPYDHKITLMPGVQPVNVKPYRYSPQ
jgi:hypothetical protein